METRENKNLTKKEISSFIAKKIGLSINYTEYVVDDLIVVLCELIKDSKLNIVSFGKFKTIFKKERLGRNPKNKVEYKISARKSVSFIPSKNLDKQYNN